MQEDAGVELTGSAMELWPNPNNTGQVNLHFAGLRSKGSTVKVQLLDLMGRPALQHSIPLAEGSRSITLELPGTIAVGVYLVQAEVEGQIYVQRLFIE